MNVKQVRNGFIQGKEYSGYIVQIGVQWMASIVSVGEKLEQEHYTEILMTEEDAEKAVHDNWIKLEQKLN